MIEISAIEYRALLIAQTKLTFIENLAKQSTTGTLYISSDVMNALFPNLAQKAVKSDA